MRLIDADKIDYIMEYEEKPSSLDYVRRSHIADEPTVEAIPTKWIEQYARRNPSLEIFIDIMLMDWRGRK